MSTVILPPPLDVDYPTSDGKPMAETELHRILMNRLIETLLARYTAEADVCVTGNLLLYYVEGNKRKHVSPDVFFVRGVPRRRRDYYLLWEEKQSPQVVIELSSASTNREDQVEKFELYQDVLKVQEYFLFDPRQEYLRPQLQGYRLVDGKYAPILPVAGRLPSAPLDLHFEADGEDLKLFDPLVLEYLLEPAAALRLEVDATHLRLQEALDLADHERQERDRERELREAADQEVARLKALLESLRKQLPGTE